MTHFSEGISVVKQHMTVINASLKTRGSITKKEREERCWSRLLTVFATHIDCWPLLNVLLHRNSGRSTGFGITGLDLSVILAF